MTARGRVAFETLGCKVSRTDAEELAAALIGRGATVCEPESADVVVVTSCTVTSEADHKARKAVRHAHSLANAPIVVVAGCGAALDDGELERLGDRVVVARHRDAVEMRVASLLHLPERGEPAPRSGDPFRTRATVKVEDGCDAFCAYCIVPYARGLPRAKPLADVVAEVEGLRSAGTREVVLTGINIGRYRDGSARLPDVVAAVAGTGIDRIRVSSIEPADVTPEFLTVAGAAPAFCGHLHVPLQSGCDRTLAEMDRTYDASGYLEVLVRARAALSGVAVTTDVLVGYPGETEADFAESLGFVEACGFAKLHVFRFSARKGTPAAARRDALPPRVVAERAARMRELGELLRRRFLAESVGRVVEVLVESIDATGARGRTREGAPARIDSQDAARSELVNAAVLGIEGGALRCRRV